MNSHINQISTVRGQSKSRARCFADICLHRGDTGRKFTNIQYPACDTACGYRLSRRWVFSIRIQVQKSLVNIQGCDPSVIELKDDNILICK